jgi:hypothetical protein
VAIFWEVGPPQSVYYYDPITIEGDEMSHKRARTGGYYVLVLLCIAIANQ